MILEDTLEAMSRMKRNKHSSDTDNDNEDQEYRDRRERNNEAVKKSRFKSRQKTQETFTRVNKLKVENKVLEDRVRTLTKELQTLKELFLAHAANTKNADLNGFDLKLLDEIPEDDTKSVLINA